MPTADTLPSTTTTTNDRKIRITLSDRAPVEIDEGRWPILAEATTHDGRLACQASREWAIIVRQHDGDGRRLVYGWHDRGPGGMPVNFRGTYRGYLVASANLSADPADSQEETDRKLGILEEETIRAIRRVAGAIGDDQLGDECIADLPAREI